MLEATLSQLVDRLPKKTINGAVDTAVSSITHDSRTVAQGCLFICLKGASHDGHNYALSAIEGGASALMVNEGGLEAVSVSLPEGFPIIAVPDTRTALPLISCAFYNDPAQKMIMVGVTGTNGKTTSALMIAAILRASGMMVGTIGTLGSEVDGEPLSSDHTTPEADQLQALLAKMLERGAKAVVMEVSSHALSQHRVAGIPFQVGVFTNITPDHLDYHKTMGEYFSAKAQLFTEYPLLFPRSDGTGFTSIINVGQWEGRDLVTLARGDILTFSVDRTAVLKADNVKLSAESCHFDAVYDDGVRKFIQPIKLPVGGAFQVANALGAIGATLRLGISPELIAEGLAKMKPVPGRFQSVPTGNRGFSVIVDYAHTPDGLENLLKSARALNPARIICMFGCGGNRDRTKRPKMGKLAGSLAEITIVTSDNPRHEDADEIIAEVLTGMDPKLDSSIVAEVNVQSDRGKAITLALSLARKNDLVLLAGKGHETYQIIGDTYHHFDDCEEVQKAIKGVASL